MPEHAPLIGESAREYRDFDNKSDKPNGRHR
jgi:hypothetical protein